MRLCRVVEVHVLHRDIYLTCLRACRPRVELWCCWGVVAVLVNHRHARSGARLDRVDLVGRFNQRHWGYVCARRCCILVNVVCCVGV
jgi:hypothetical protein